MWNISTFSLKGPEGRPAVSTPASASWSPVLAPWSWVASASRVTPLACSLPAPAPPAPASTSAPTPTSSSPTPAPTSIPTPVPSPVSSPWTFLRSFVFRQLNLQLPPIVSPRESSHSPRQRLLPAVQGVNGVIRVILVQEPGEGKYHPIPLT